MTEWKPIETAPKTEDVNDALEVLGWLPDPTSCYGGDREVVWWEPNPLMNCWVSSKTCGLAPPHCAVHPTMWQELPERPNVAVEGERGSDGKVRNRCPMCGYEFDVIMSRANVCPNHGNRDSYEPCQLVGEWDDVAWDQ